MVGEHLRLRRRRVLRERRFVRALAREMGVVALDERAELRSSPSPSSP